MTAGATGVLAIVLAHGNHLQMAVCQKKIDAYENRRFDVSGTLEYQTNRISRKRT
jgi:hypothetical protein